jgi:cell division septum initiation protein DivIVA
VRGRDKDHIYNMAYDELLAPIVKSIQQQQQEITDDKQEIADDKANLKHLTDDNADLRRLIAAQQKEIELMKWQIRILAQPHPAKVDLPTSLPGNP